jgi:regulator of sigma E protease
MHTVLVALVSVLIVLGIMVLVHEFGHFVAAKLCGVRVEQFSIGFPPRLFGIKIGDTDYCISATPLGGYVKMTGESMPGENMSLDGADHDLIAAQKSDPGALTSHPRWQRIIIGLAGPCANFVLALGLMTGFYMLHNEVPLYEDMPIQLDWVVPDSPAGNAGLKAGDTILNFDSQPHPTWETVGERSELNLQSQNISHDVPVVVERDGKQVSTTVSLASAMGGSDSVSRAKAAEDFSLEKLGFLPVYQSGPVKVTAVSVNSPASRAGIQTGDELISVDGHAFHSVPIIVSYLQSGKGTPLTIVVNHNGQQSTRIAQPFWDTSNGTPAWRIGFNGAAPPFRVEQMPPLKALKASVKFNRENSLLILEVLQRVLTHRMSVNTLSGPIGIARETGQAAETPGWEAKFKVMTAISLNLGILNLLPFPILDGGMILFLLIESVIRRDIDVRIKERVYQVAFVLILVFAAYIIFNDISKLPIFAQTRP